MVYLRKTAQVAVAAIGMFTLGSCLSGNVSAPSAVAGDIPFALSNETEMRMCEFHMVPVGTNGQGENWVGLLVFQTGTTKELKIKAGDYRLDTKGCGPSFDGVMASVHVTGPTHLTVGAKDAHVSHMAGYANVLMPVRFAPQGSGTGCVETNFYPDDGKASSCCSKRGHMDVVNPSNGERKMVCE